ncbi:MAG: flagellar motor protein MotB [Candidatus Hydrogenedentota bacterium]
MAVKKKCPECEEGAPLWVVTFGDLMTLLMTFFVLLLSFATMEEPRKYEEAIISIRGAFGVMPSNITAVQINPMPVRVKRLPQKSEEVAREIQREIQVDGYASHVRVEYDDSGALKINLPARVLYESGEAVLREDSYPFLIAIAQILGRYPDAFFEVHGHTDNTSLTEPSIFRDNLDLSYARAERVARFLSQYGPIPIDRFEAVARGSGAPFEPNTTEEGRIANRRVELYVRGLLTKKEVEDLQDEVNRLDEL